MKAVGETPAGDELAHPLAPPELQGFGAAALDSARLRQARSRSVALALWLLMVAIGLGVSVVVSRRDPWFQPFDDWWRTFVVTNRHPALTAVAEALSVAGSVHVTLPVRLGIVGILGVRRRWTQLGAFVTAVVASEILVGTVKAIVDRPRPPDPMVLSSSTSFPSGHAIATAVTAFGIVAAFLPRGSRRWHWIVVASTVASLMALSRTYLSVHWATDTIAGTAIGVACAVLAEAAFEGGRYAVATEHADAVRDSV